MSRFDVYPAPGNGAGYVLDVQANFLQDLGTRVVVPLLPFEVASKPSRGLNPVFEIEGRSYMMLTQSIGTVTTKRLRKAVVSLGAYQDDITRALDVLLTGI